MKMWAGLVGLGLIGPPALAGDLIGASVKLLAGSGRFGEFRADFSIENTNPFPIKDVQIVCFVYAKSGTALRD
jgi:hypothetical protein